MPHASPAARCPAPSRSPVGTPSSLEPLPKPFTTSPRQKYGRCLMAATERPALPAAPSLAEPGLAPPLPAAAAAPASPRAPPRGG